ncbi:hypothetical protein H072_486 [Dactylellina haptotyla CBS 200.50]|uniref:F-box domain-containing protein n=1 Tax=Dactylellina haptotyla (strain CBS 200.50) TaxID=1284197 RepID=S8ARP8_DACHA|nr:hypothetical protein H072_486 [Dactylellina haptotyla CBS 200.50]
MDFTSKLSNGLLSEIFTFLPTTLPSPLYSTVLVCKRFHEHATPILYSHITLTSIESPQSFHQPSLDALSNSPHLKHVKKFSIRTVPCEVYDDGSYTIKPRALEDMGLQLSFFCLKFEEGQVKEVTTDHLGIMAYTPSHLRQVTKFATATLYSRGGQELDAARETELFISLQELRINDFAGGFSNFARAWKFLQSVRSTLKKVHFVGSGALMVIYVSEENQLGSILEKYTFSNEEGGGRLDNVEELMLEYLVKLDDVIVPFGKMIDMEKVRRMKMVLCETSFAFMSHAVGIMKDLIHLDLSVGNGGREKIEEVLKGVSSTGLRSLRIKCADKTGAGRKISIDAFEKHQGTLRRLWVEYYTKQPDQIIVAEDEDEDKWMQEIPVRWHKDASDDLNLETLAGFAMLEHLAVALDKDRAWDDWAPKFPSLKSLHVLNSRQLQHRMTSELLPFQKAWVKWFASPYEERTCPLQVVSFEDGEDLTWYNLGAHSGLPRIDGLQDLDPQARVSRKDVKLWYPDIGDFLDIGY